MSKYKGYGKKRTKRHANLYLHQQLDDLSNRIVVIPKKEKSDGEQKEKTSSW